MKLVTTLHLLCVLQWRRPREPAGQSLYSIVWPYTFSLVDTALMAIKSKWPEREREREKEREREEI
jgi:hypothetical protein